MIDAVDFFEQWEILFYCSEYIILLSYLYYFIMLKTKIDSCYSMCVDKINEVTFDKTKQLNF